MDELSVIDLGCGPNKVPGAFGVDHHPYPGVDRVMDINATPWPLAADAYDTIYARHVIEHVADVVAFMRNIHRIGRDGALVHIVTPHFSSLNSWKDTTHLRHLSSQWYESFTDEYLAAQVDRFEHVATEVQFARHSLRALIPRLMVRVMGLVWWEKHYAFVYRARNLTTRLRVVKGPAA